MPKLSWGAMVLSTACPVVLLFPGGVVLKNEKRHLSDTSAPSSTAWSRYAQSATPFKGVLGVGEGRNIKRMEIQNVFSSLTRVSLEPMERGLPALNKLLQVVLH